MSNALQTADAKNYIALSDGGAIAEAMNANMGEGAALSEGDLTRVSIPAGGATTWVVPSIAGDEETKEIVGVLAYMCPRGLLWQGEDAAEGSLPVLVSHDLRTAHRVLDVEEVDPQLNTDIDAATDSEGRIRWDDLPQTQFGSGRQGVGKEAKEQRVLYILRENDTLPIVVTIAPGSLKSWKKFVVELTKAGLPHYRAIVGLSLKASKSTNGTKFAEVVPRLVASLTPEQGQLVKEKITPVAQVAAAGAFIS